MVVYLRACAPRAHCANVTIPAPTSFSAPRIAGRSQIGACGANCGHHARPHEAPQSAGFSNAQCTPAPCATVTSSAANPASAMCRRR
eukprot:4544404-Pleurochrysis_carterae.AAC.1